MRWDIVAGIFKDLARTLVSGAFWALVYGGAVLLVGALASLPGACFIHFYFKQDWSVAFATSWPSAVALFFFSRWLHDEYVSRKMTEDR